MSDMDLRSVRFLHESFSPLDLIQGFADAQKALYAIRLTVAGVNSYAWNKLDRMQDYLTREQTRIATEYFRDAEAA